MPRKILPAMLMCLSLWWMPVYAQGPAPREIHFVDAPYPPYTIGEEGRSPTGGVAVELVRELFRRLHVKLTIELVPWNRVLKMAEVGRADGITLLMRNEERDRFLVFSDEVLEAKEVFYYKRDRFRAFTWRSFNDLKPYKIGLVHGYTYGEGFVRAIEKLGLRIDYCDTDQNGLQKLMAGRIDLFLCDELVGRSQLALNADMKKALLASLDPVTVYSYYVAFSRLSEAKALLPEVNQVIAEMKADGVIDRILEEGW